MTHVCCPSCRLRFTRAAAAHLVACPECDKPLQSIASLELAFGFRVFRFEDPAHSLPEAVAVAIPSFEPELTPNRSS